MDLVTSKNLGGVGAILIFIGPLATLGTAFGGLLSLIGFILVLIALYGLSGYYNESGILNNAIYGFVASIVGVVVAGGVFIGMALSALGDLGIEDWTNVSEWTSVEWTANLTVDFAFDILGGLIIAAVILFVFAIISAFLYKRSLNMLGAKSGVNLFNTTGLILLIGAVLTIILIGALLVWIAFLLLAIAFFSIKTTPVESPASSQETATSPST